AARCFAIKKNAKAAAIALLLQISELASLPIVRAARAKCRTLPIKLWISARPDVPLHFCKIAGVPTDTACATAAASQLVKRIQPCDCVLPMVEGSGVPWIP